MQKGFTLVELLIVVSIVAVLASIVLASLNGARTKAQVSSGQQFESTIYHAIGDTAKGVWNLDTVSLSGGSTGNGTAVDLNSSNNALNLVSVSTDPATFDGTGQAMTFAGNAGSYAQTANTVNLSSPLTLSVWIKTTANPVTTTLISMPVGFNSLNLLLVFGQPAVYIPMANNTVQSVAASARKLNDGKWHQLSWTFDNSARKYAFYEDGKLDSVGTIPSDAAVFGSNTVTIGTGPYGSYSGDMDNIKIFNSYAGQ